MIINNKVKNEKQGQHEQRKYVRTVSLLHEDCAYFAAAAEARRSALSFIGCAMANRSGALLVNGAYVFPTKEEQARFDEILSEMERLEIYKLAFSWDKVEGIV